MQRRVATKCGCSCLNNIAGKRRHHKPSDNGLFRTPANWTMFQGKGRTMKLDALDWWIWCMIFSLKGDRCTSMPHQPWCDSRLWGKKSRSFSTKAQPLSRCHNSPSSWQSRSSYTQATASWMIVMMIDMMLKHCNNCDVIVREFKCQKTVRGLKCLAMVRWPTVVTDNVLATLLEPARSSSWSLMKSFSTVKSSYILCDATLWCQNDDHVVTSTECGCSRSWRRRTWEFLHSR